MGGERASTTRMREQGKICCRCKTFLKPVPVRERYCDRCDPANRHRVYMNFMFVQGGWYCQFLEPDLKTSLRRKLVYQDSQKIIEMARRGGADFTLAGRQGIEEGIAKGRGGVWLELTGMQYGTLK